MKSVEITVSPTGEIKVETKGFQGAECLSASRDYEKALGVVTSDKKTGDYYATDSETNQVNQGAGGNPPGWESV